MRFKTIASAHMMQEERQRCDTKQNLMFRAGQQPLCQLRNPRKLSGLITCRLKWRDQFEHSSKGGSEKPNRQTGATRNDNFLEFRR